MRKKSYKPRVITAQYLENVGFFYLSRYASSCESLRRVLLRRVARALAGADEETLEKRAAYEALVEVQVQKFKELGLLNDARYATHYLAALRHKGASARLAREKLRAKGLSSQIIAEVLAGEKEQDAQGENTPDPELSAAVRYAQLRRLGPFRKAGLEKDQKQQDKDLAALVRRGFSLGLARQVLLAPTPAAALTLLVPEEESQNVT